MAQASHKDVITPLKFYGPLDYGTKRPAMIRWNRYI